MQQQQNTTDSSCNSTPPAAPPTPLQTIYVSSPGSGALPTLVSSNDLAALLREAKRAHAHFESETGTTDKDWPGWYARYILAALKEHK